MAEVIIIGRFVPTCLEKETIEREIRHYLPPCCRSERLVVRVPPSIKNIENDNLQWHQDGGGPEGLTTHMIVWASTNPTNFLLSNGKEFIQSPFDVVWFNNYVAKHRWPLIAAINPNRWFVSLRCEAPNSEVEKWLTSGSQG